MRETAFCAKGVYPRMYGETLLTISYCGHGEGLSPHVRGNRQKLLILRGRGGSIPACTGKPGGRPQPSATAGVYPRMYGETGKSNATYAGVGGLSPHVRGNPKQRHTGFDELGSIPACTGKPSG